MNSHRVQANRRARHMRRPAAVVAVAGLLLAAGCGADDGTVAERPDADSPISVTLGVFAITDAAVPLMGEDQGIFEEHGIDLDITTVATDAISQSVMSGQVDMALDSGVHNTTAVSQGLPLQFVTGLSTWQPGSGGEITNGMLVTNDGPGSGSELNNATVAVVALGGAAQLSVEAYVDKLGGDSKTLKFTTLPLPAMENALKEGQIDAASVNDPYYQQFLASGDFSDTFGDPSAEAFGSAPRLTVITSKEFAAGNPGAIEAFQDAMNEAVEYAENNPDQVGATMIEWFDTPPDTAETMQLPQLQSEIPEEELTKLQDLMLEYGYLEDSVPVSDLTVK